MARPDGGRRRFGRRSTLLACAAVVVLAAGGILAATRTEKHSVVGTLSLAVTDTDGTLDMAGPCRGKGGYDDIREGRQIVIEDASGTTLATSNLGVGTTEGIRCVFNFDFEGVPKSSFYRVHQNGNRGTIQYSYGDMVTSNWSIDLSLGD